MENIYYKRLNSLRVLMREKNWDVVIIGGSDPHNSEYIAPHWRGVEWLSGFTGEGDIVVTMHDAGVWTDSRYFIQANSQLQNTGFTLHKTRVAEQVLIPKWLVNTFADAIGQGLSICVDGVNQHYSTIIDIEDEFRKVGFDINDSEFGLQIINTSNVLNLIWQDRPSIPYTPIFTLPTNITGESRESKINWLRTYLDNNNIGAMLVSSLDQVAWLLNIRANDIPCNPLCISYLWVDFEKIIWFVKKNNSLYIEQTTQDTFAELKEAGIQISNYEDVEIEIAKYLQYTNYKLLADSLSLNYNLYKLMMSIKEGQNIVIIQSPIALRKAVKNDVEINGMRKAHFYDGIAMEKFLYWLEKRVQFGDGINEQEALQKINSLRGEQPGFKGVSFETISAYASSAALPHYTTPTSYSQMLYPRGLYLCDSGGQYIYGTTDITRTIPLGDCSALEKEDYTLVLKGHINLAMAVFPQGTSGCHLDILARNPLWGCKRNYGHGTGHGVGTFLNVHEGPQDIRQNYKQVPIMPGMVTSNEPGIYREGKYGIRHENLLLCCPAGNNDFGQWLRFEVLTLCHIDTSIVDKKLLNQMEIDWLNNYNKRVYDTLHKHLSNEVAKWLYEKTLPI